MIRIAHWKDMDRWDWVLRSSVSSEARFDCLQNVGDVLRRRNERVDRSKVRFSELLPIPIHFDGSLSKRTIKPGKEYSLPMLWARPGDIVLSKIDLKNGAVGIVPDDWENVAVTTHFAVYEPISAKLHSRFFRLLIQTPPVKEWLSSNKSGADGRKEVKLEDFEDLEIPLPEPTEQRQLMSVYESTLGKSAKLDADASVWRV